MWSDVCLNDGLFPFPRRDDSEIANIQWGHLKIENALEALKKIFDIKTIWPNVTKLGKKNTWGKGIHV